MDLLSQLNPQQREAVTTTDGPVLVLAGAGSGKTRVIIHRIAYLLQRGVSASRILAVTFTNKAANEMKERIAALVGPQRAADLTISTFHSFGLQVTRRSRQALGLSSTATIIDEADRSAIIKAVRAEMGVSEKALSLEETEQFLMQVKGCGEEPDAQAASLGARKKALLLKFYDLYTRRLRLGESLDFDDLILLPVQLLERNPRARERYQEMFDYILVDEYQDTNFLQFRLLRLLADRTRNICVVGDDDQSIYGWRGARVENILEFDREYPQARIIKLTRNYRSQANILQLANALIARNTQRREKELWTDASDEVPALRLRYDNQQEEARDIAERIRDMIRQQNMRARDIAVLYRTKGQSRYFQEALRLLGIPYRVVGSYDFFERKEVRDIMAYLRLVCNPQDQVAFRRVVNYPSRGIGLATLEKLEALRGDRRSSIKAARALLELDNGQLTARTRRSLTTFLDLIEKHFRTTRLVEGPALADAVETLLAEAGVRDDLIARGPGAYKALTTLTHTLRRGLEGEHFATLNGFLEKLTLDQREAESGKGESPDDLVTLMTVHSAKGLEFDAVFLVGLVDGMFPHFRSVGDAAGLEEERRLFYVAITRSRKHLFVSSFRQKEERGEVRPTRASRFLKELPAELLHTRAETRASVVDKGDFLAALEELERGL